MRGDGRFDGKLIGWLSDEGEHRAVVGVCSQGDACARLTLPRAGGVMLRGLVEKNRFGVGEAYWEGRVGEVWQ